MLKYQIGLVVIGVALVGWLYSLPKVVVDNKKQASVESGHVNEPAKNSAPDTLHDIKIPKEVLSKIQVFESAFIKATEKKNKIRFADSLAVTYQYNKKYDSAAKYREVIAELEPNSKTLEAAADVFTEAANFSVDQNKVKVNSAKAQQYYLEVLKKSPDNLDVKSKLAMTYVNTETPMAGIKILREVVEKDPDNQLAIFNLGILSLQSKQFDKAVQRFEKLVDLNPEHWKARFYLGLSYKELGQKAKAIDQFELVKKLEEDPEVKSIANSYLEELK